MGDRRGFWEGIRAGLSVADATAGVGVPKQAGYHWFVEAGGVKPPRDIQPASYRCRSIRERIHAGMKRWESIRTIAREICRTPSSVQRALPRMAVA